MCVAVPEYEVVKVRSIRRRRGAGVRPEEDKSRVMKLQAFGRDLELTLRKSDGLFKDKLRMWAAEPNSTGSINYTELPHVSIPLFPFSAFRIITMGCA